MEQRSRDRTGAACITRETGVHGISGRRQQSKRVVPRIFLIKDSSRTDMISVRVFCYAGFVRLG